MLFGAERCVHYKALHPALKEALQEEFANSFLTHYVGINANKDIIAVCHIQEIPVVAVHRNGEETRRFHGERDYNDVCDFLDAMLV